MREYAATIGMFDGLHRGHLCLLRQLVQTARERGLGCLCVTMSTHPRTLLTGQEMPLLTSPKEKLKQLRSVEGIDRVVELHLTASDMDVPAKDFMLRLREEYGVRLIVMGYDHRFGHEAPSATADDYVQWGREAGVEVMRAKQLQGENHVSSSVIRRALQEGDVKGAADGLGRRYCIEGCVVTGQQVGRTIGYPTANLSLNDPRVMLPREGVYAALAETEGGETRAAMVNIGNRPTIDSRDENTIEAHLIGYKGNLYGKNLKLHFIKRLRETRLFPDKEQLRRQLIQDEKDTLNLLAAGADN